MQAQDFNMANWAVGVRLPGTTQQDIAAAFNAGHILRTHLLRPTWHLVSADDVYWMLGLTAPRLKAAMKTRWKELELDTATCNRCISLIEQALGRGQHLTREALMAMLEEAGISTAGQRSAHIMFYAELEQVVCSGISQGKQQTYALLSERVPQKMLMPPEQALGELARRYFTSHGPATLHDFTWWAGLSATDAKKAVEIVKDGFSHVEVEGLVYYFSAALPDANPPKPSAYLLPAFDEFIISYKNRSASLRDENFAKVVSNNGIFWPVIVVKGQVAGVWKRAEKKNIVQVELAYFNKPSQAVVRLVQKAAKRLGLFLGLRAELAEAVA